MSNQPHIFLALPSYNGQRFDASNQAVEWAITLNKPIVPCRSSASLLAGLFNDLWITAHERRRLYGDITHFAMLHADVAPLVPNWLTILLEEMQEHNLDAICAAVPMKEDEGRMTSIGRHVEVEGRTISERYSQNRLADLPPTFAADHICRQGERLLLNTGCFLVDIRGEWCDPTKVYFEIDDSIVREDGALVRKGIGEDYKWSLLAAEAGARLGVTSKIPIQHWGTFAWDTIDLAESQREKS